METTDLMPLLEQLEDNIDDLEDALEPLLSQALSATTQKMPVLDKAKLHVFVAATIETLIFSYFNLHGVNAKEHAVFKELTRAKQYNEKIKALEKGPEKRNMTLDKEAAGRFIKHGLAGNDKYDLERAEREAKEKAMAQLKAAKLARQQALSQKRPAEQISTEGSPEERESGMEEETGDLAAGNQSPQAEEGQQNKKIKTNGTEEDLRKQQKREKKRLKQLAKRHKAAAKKAVESENA